MADNINELPLDSPLDEEMENPSDETISAKDTDIINLNQASENMEVHHHPDLHHKPKKWKEYFLEFLMIFLAVTMGFFAENVREHVGDRKKEAEYIKGLSEDFKTDTSEINFAIKYNESKLYNDTSLIRLLYESKTDPVNLKKIYALYPATRSFATQFSDSRTFDLLKNTGDLKLIKNELVLTKISSYYRLTTLEKIYSNEIQTILVTTYNFSNKCIDLYASEKLTDRKLALITTNDETIREYSNYLYLLSSNLMEYKRHLLHVKSEASALIELIEKEYHL